MINEKILTSHGKFWTKAEEDRLLQLVRAGENWYTIAETIGRTGGACKARFKLIERGESPLQGSAPSSPSTASPPETLKSEKQLPWTTEDEILLLELRALGRSYNDIADLLSVSRDPRSIANHHLAVTNRGITFLEERDKKNVDPSMSTIKVMDKNRKVTTDYDHLEDIIHEMNKLSLEQSAKRSTICCFHCHRPSWSNSTSRQPLCLQCKTVKKCFSVDGLFDFLETVKKTRMTKKDRVPVGKEGLTFIWKHEYAKYLQLDLSDRSENESKNSRPRASCETLLKLATENGLTDTYTNIEGHWSAKDDIWRLTFAYIVSENGGIKLKPVLALIARLSECSTEEQIKDWVDALRSN